MRRREELLLHPVLLEANLIDYENRELAQARWPHLIDRIWYNGSCKDHPGGDQERRKRA